MSLTKDEWRMITVRKRVEYLNPTMDEYTLRSRSILSARKNYGFGLKYGAELYDKTRDLDYVIKQGVLQCQDTIH